MDRMEQEPMLGDKFLHSEYQQGGLWGREGAGFAGTLPDLGSINLKRLRRRNVRLLLFKKAQEKRSAPAFVFFKLLAFCGF